MESNIILYTSNNGDVSIQVQYEDGTFWLTQKRMAELFGVNVNTINYHLKELYNSAEIQEDRTIRKIRIVQKEGKREVEREVTFYHLDAIIAVGYKVNSVEAVQFRQWATKTLNEFITKGYVLDKDRLKQGAQFGHDYFKELLEDIREIRASERRFYQKITDIYALSIDYDKDAPETKQFFATVQNKLHWAISGKTAAEIIYHTADAEKPHMGLTTWRHAPDGKIMKSDVSIAKNYLDEKELKVLNNLVSGYFDIAEINALEHRPMYMNDYIAQLDRVLSSSGRQLLTNAGKVSHKQAIDKASKEYRKYQVKTLSPVEEEYLKVVQDLNKTAKKKSRDRK